MNIIGLASYHASTVTFAILIILLLTKWRGRLFNHFFLLASVISVVWAITVSLIYLPDANPTSAIAMMEIIRYVAWFTLIFQFLKRDEPSSSLNTFKYTVLIACSFAFVFFLLDSYGIFRAPFSSFWIMLILAILVLVAV